LNDANQVVGNAETPAPNLPAGRTLHAFLWTAQAGMVDLGTLGGASSSAADINASGQIVGSASTAEGFPHAFLRNPGDTALQDLGTLGGASSTAIAINDSGVVVGGSLTSSGSAHAFIWTSTDGMVDLNARVTTAPAGLELSFAEAISDSGFVLAQSNQGLVLLKPDCAGGGAGFVTGTVRFQSPGGGQASLNSVVRNGVNSPTGHTVLSMDGFIFTATAYDQLLVSDGRAQYSGQGTLNGVGGYFFRITEIDSGQPGGRGDAVQIRIWHIDASTQSEVVDYDTGETSVPTDNGNIVVHVR
jgi:probable HAF family extracellular repeat protein